MAPFFTYLCYVLRIYIYRPSIKGHELTGGEKNHNIEAGGFLNKTSSPTMLYTPRERLSKIGSFG